MYKATDIAQVDELFKDLIPFFMQNRQTELVDLEKWLSAGDFGAIAKLGHKLFGSGSTYGFKFLAQLARDLESAGQKCDADSVRKVIGDIRNHIESVKIEFVDYNGSNSAAVTY